MKIYTLGTSHGDATYCRFNSSTLYEIGDSLYLIDSGSPVDALMIRMGKKIQKLKAIFITHMHADHAAGIDRIISQLIKYPIPGQHTTIFFPEEGVKEALFSWLKAMNISRIPEELFDFKVTKSGDVYNDGLISVRAVRTQHISFSYAYTLEAESKKILHSGDLRWDFSDFPQEAQTEHFDLCFCEATHYKPSDAVPVLKTAGFDRLVFIHIHNPWHGEDGERSLLSNYVGLPYPVSIAHDGDCFEL